MTDEATKILLNMSRALIERIDDFRFENRVTSRAEAIRRLIEEGLKRYEKKRVPKSTP